jgi:hypothetical protein
MRIVNAFRFLFQFIIIAILTFIICLVFGTISSLSFLKSNGIILTNDEEDRK